MLATAVEMFVMVALIAATGAKSAVVVLAIWAAREAVGVPVTAVVLRRATRNLLHRAIPRSASRARGSLATVIVTCAVRRLMPAGGLRSRGSRSSSPPGPWPSCFRRTWSTVVPSTACWDSSDPRWHDSEASRSNHDRARSNVGSPRDEVHAAVAELGRLRRAVHLQKALGARPNTIDMFKVARQRHYLTVGSVLRMADANSIVWGRGSSITTTASV